MTISSILANLRIPSAAAYSSSFSQTQDSTPVASQVKGVAADKVSISEGASLLSSISNINAKLDEYEKSVASGDVSAVAKNLVALKLELAAFKEKIKSMQLQFEILNAIMDMLDSAEAKINKLSAKT